jgi:hypothetical protein
MKARLPVALLLLCINQTAFSDNQDGARDLGVDYAFMSLITLSPDFAAANYTITNDAGLDVDISIYRLPYHIDLVSDGRSKLKLELAAAYQNTQEIIPTFPSIPGEYVDATWETYGFGLGLLYENRISEQWLFLPSVRLGVARMNNKADYNGLLTNAIKDQFEGTFFNWDTNSAVLNLGLGIKYDWTLLDRSSSITANIYHVIVDSFDESNQAFKFTEKANLLSVKADLIEPSEFYIADHRMDFVFLFGLNHFFGDNRRTLGYTTSYEAGIGAEFPLKYVNTTYGHIRFSGQLLWADNMKGWLITVGYNPE